MTDVQTTLAAWREQGADALDPLRFHLIDTMARRAATQEGGARKILDARVRDLVDGYASKVAKAGAAGTSETHAEAKTRANAGTALAASATPKQSADIAPAMLQSAVPANPASHLVDLINYFHQQTAASDAHRTLRKVALQRSTYPELPEIDYFRDALSKVSTNRQVRQSLERVPENAGPLNSDHLVHRSLLMMRDLSPGYLQHFLAYVDGLSWMEQVNAFNLPVSKPTARSGAPKKTGRTKAKPA